MSEDFHPMSRGYEIASEIEKAHMSGFGWPNEVGLFIAKLEARVAALEKRLAAPQSPPADRAAGESVSNPQR